MFSLFLGFTLALTATLGSLFFSEIMYYPPCLLCWYQRICMYPLVILFAMGLFGQRANEVVKYAFPLTLIGWGISIYHNLLYYGILPEGSSPCREGVSCTDVQLELFGFITIPMLSFIGFTAIIICLVKLQRTK